jgi:cyclophilin family peptidyl-prolyl cis-trans isomerase
MVRSLLTGFVLTIVALVAFACGSGNGDSPNIFDTQAPSERPTAAPTPGIDTSATCGPPGSSIAAIQRTGQRVFSAAPERVTDPEKTYVATLKTSKGDIVMELTAKDTPLTVNNFVFLSCTGFYDGLTFHRYEPGFVIQGGDRLGNGRGDAGYRFATEINPTLKHDAAGIVAMANGGANTNGTQFYITLGPAPHLDSPPAYNIFGRVTSGMNVVQSIRVGDRITGVSIEER